MVNDGVPEWIMQATNANDLLQQVCNKAVCEHAAVDCESVEGSKKGPFTVTVKCGDRKLEVTLNEDIKEAPKAKNIARELVFKSYYPQHELSEAAAPYAHVKATMLSKVELKKNLKVWRSTKLEVAKQKMIALHELEEVDPARKAYQVEVSRRQTNKYTGVGFQIPKYTEINFETRRENPEFEKPESYTALAMKSTKVFSLDIEFEFEREGHVIHGAAVVHKKVEGEEPQFLFRVQEDQEQAKTDFVLLLADLKKVKGNALLPEKSRARGPQAALKNSICGQILEGLRNEGIISELEDIETARQAQLEEKKSQAEAKKEAKKEANKASREANKPANDGNGEKKKRGRGGKGRKRGGEGGNSGPREAKVSKSSYKGIPQGRSQWISAAMQGSWQGNGNMPNNNFQPNTGVNNFQQSAQPSQQQWRPQPGSQQSNFQHGNNSAPTGGPQNLNDLMGLQNAQMEQMKRMQQEQLAQFQMTQGYR
jgi:hypothetical protein